MPGLPRLRDGGLPRLREGGLPAPLPPFLPRPQDGPDILLISGVWGWWLGPLCFLHAQQSLGGRRVLVICGKTQVPVSPPAFSLLFLLILQGPLPGQAVGDRGSAQPQGDAQSIPLASIVGRGRRAGLHPARPLELGSTRLGVPHHHCNGGPPAWAPLRPHWNGGPPAWAPRGVAGWSLLGPKGAGEPGRARL